ncbi:signal peptidase I [Streptomyces diastaticus]
MTTGGLAGTSGPEDAPERGGRGRRVVGAVVAAAGLVVLALAATALLSVRIDGDSMEPTLHDGERVLPLPVSEDDVGRFDVVLMRTPGRDVLLVKRVVALPGDQVRIAPGPAAGQRVLVRRAGAGRWHEFTVPGAAEAGLPTPLLRRRRKAFGGPGRAYGAAREVLLPRRPRRPVGRRADLRVGRSGRRVRPGVAAHVAAAGGGPPRRRGATAPVGRAVNAGGGARAWGRPGAPGDASALRRAVSCRIVSAAWRGRR